MINPSDVHGEYMFGILAYETWNLYADKQWVGQITINGPDGSAVLTENPDIPGLAQFFANKSFTWWMRWLRDNQFDPL